MKKAIYLGLFLTLAVPFTSFAAFDSSLKYGASGPAVKEMQEFLVDQGACNITPSGNFFALTLKCVKAFQTNEGISPASGYWGPMTRAKASEKLDLSVSDADEKTETGSVAVQTNEVYNSPMTTTPIAPTCEIIANYYNDGQYNNIAISWTSKNAVEATIYADWYKNGKGSQMLTVEKTNFPVSSSQYNIEAGSRKGFVSPIGTDTPIKFYGIFYGEGGKTKTICQTTLNAIR